MSKFNIPLIYRDQKVIHKLSPFAFWTGAMIWLKLPMSRTNFHSLQYVRAIDVWLYVIVMYFVADLLETIKKNNEKLDQIQKGLQDYLASKRDAFPRYTLTAL